VSVTLRAKMQLGCQAIRFAETKARQLLAAPFHFWKDAESPLGLTCLHFRVDSAAAIATNS